MIAACLAQQAISRATSVSLRCCKDLTDFKELLVEQARWGDANAYLKLAECYRKGEGVKKDFLCMISMAEMAAQRGAISSVGNYINGLPDSDDYKALYMLFSAPPGLNSDSIVNVLMKKNVSEAKVIAAEMAASRGDTIRCVELIKQAEDEGSTFAKIYKMLLNDNVEDTILLQMADDLPIIYAKLGDKYYDADQDGIRNEQLAIKYYMKAEKHAMLNQRRAKRVLSHHERCGSYPLADNDLKHLRLIVGDKTDASELREQQFK